MVRLSADLHKNWDGNESGLATLLGESLAHIPNFSDQFCKAFGTTLFEKIMIWDRIEYLRDKKSTKELDEIILFYCQNNTTYLTDTYGRFGRISIRIVQNECYSIEFSYRSDSGISGSWDFDVIDGKLSICEPSDAFLMIQETRRAAKMVEITSNILGYQP